MHNISRRRHSKTCEHGEEASSGGKKVGFGVAVMFWG